MLLQVSAGNSPINYRKNKDVANLYNKAIDYVIAQLDVKESEVYILNGLNFMSWHPNNTSTFQNDSIIKIITYLSYIKHSISSYLKWLKIRCWMFTDRTD